MWQVGPSMTWPIFEGGRIRAYIEVRNAQEEQALLSYRKTVLIALAEVEDALVAYAKERTRHQALAASAKTSSARSYLRSIVTRRAMPPISTSLRRSDRSTRRRTHWRRAISKLIDDLIAIYKALGGGWQTDPRRPQSSNFPPVAEARVALPPLNPRAAVLPGEPLAVVTECKITPKLRTISPTLWIVRRRRSVQSRNQKDPHRHNLVAGEISFW